jgi:hypothetical protein
MSAPARDRGGRHLSGSAARRLPMLRRLIAAGVMLLFFVGLIIADEAKGKITKVEDKKGTVITVKVDDKETKFRVNKDTKIKDADGKDVDVKDAGTKLKEGDEVTVKFEEKEVDGKKRKIVSDITVSKPK